MVKKSEETVHSDIQEPTNSTVKEIKNPLSVGARLSKARQRKNLEIDDVSEVLRIKPVYLEALEKGHYYAFPARSYAVGFLRSYATYLKLNSDDLVNLFYQETNNVKEEPLDMLVIEKHFSLPSFKLVLWSLGILLAVYIVWYLIAAYFYPDTLVRKEPELLEQAAGKTEVIQNDSEKEKPEATKDKKEENVVAEETEKPKIPVIEQVAEEAFSAPLAFVATDRVWVSIKDTAVNRVILDKVFVKNEHYIPKFSSSDNIVVSTGKADAVELYKKGKKIKTLSKEVETPLEDLEDTGWF